MHFLLFSFSCYFFPVFSFPPSPILFFLSFLVSYSILVFPFFLSSLSLSFPPFPLHSSFIFAFSLVFLLPIFTFPFSFTPYPLGLSTLLLPLILSFLFLAYLSPFLFCFFLFPFSPHSFPFILSLFFSYCTFLPPPPPRHKVAERNARVS